MSIFSGIIRATKTAAKLQTAAGSYVLDPYLEDAPLPPKSRQEMGVYLFGYLDGRDIKITGELKKGTIYNARVSVSRKAAVKDIEIAPESTDPLAGEIEQYFGRGSSEIAGKLNEVGIRTVSAFYHRLNNSYHEEVKVFSKYLKVPQGSIQDFLKKLQSDTATSVLVQASPRFPIKRGIDLNLLAGAKGRSFGARKAAPLAPPKFPENAATPELPTSVSLMQYVTKVKNQGLRGTCVAHTAAACLEAEYIRLRAETRKLDLSEQYLYWACKQIDGAADEEGTLLKYAAEVLFDGVPAEKLAGGDCKETSWKYNRFPLAKNEAQGPLPEKARKAVARREYRAQAAQVLEHQSIPVLKQTLNDGHCIGLSVFTYHFWEDDYTWREGVISLPLGIKPNGAHAICLVGYQDNDATHQDGYFIFKNHWGEEWGHSRNDKGFGSLPYRYVLREALEAYAFEAAGPAPK